MITWLNKQITENNLVNQKLATMDSHAIGNVNNAVIFKPTGTLLPNNLHMTNGDLASSTSSNLGSLSNGLGHIDSTLGNGSNIGMLRINSTSALTNTLSSSSTNQFLNKSNANTNDRLLLSSNHVQTFSNGYQPRSALSSSSSSSIQNEALKENQENGSTRLDPKYFQSHSPHITPSLDVVPLKPQATKQPANLATTSAVRINKHLVTGPLSSNNSNGTSTQPQQGPINGNQSQFNSQLATKSTPSLASAYFPAN